MDSRAGQEFWRDEGQPVANPTARFYIRGMENSQLAQYLPVLILGLVAVAFSFGILVASEVLGRLANRNRRKLGHQDATKDIPYDWSRKDG